MGQDFENTTFRFVKLSAVGFLRPKSYFQHLNRVIWHLTLTYYLVAGENITPSGPLHIPRTSIWLVL